MCLDLLVYVCAWADPWGPIRLLLHQFFQWTLAHPPTKTKYFYSLNFSSFCDNVVKKLVSEIRKCCQLQRTKYLLSPLTMKCWRRTAPTLAKKSKFPKVM